LQKQDSGECRTPFSNARDPANRELISSSDDANLPAIAPLIAQPGLLSGSNWAIDLSSLRTPSGIIDAIAPLLTHMPKRSFRMVKQGPAVTDKGVHMTKYCIPLRSILLAGTAAALSLSTSAFAQQTAETVVVTGSRIPTNNLQTAAPVSIETAEKFQMTKAFSLEDILTKMTGPDVVGGTSISSNNGGNGLSTVGLRTLGPTRTLILVDGQRLIPQFVTSYSAPDLNSVPLAMVDRVEVLRDGASSIYGADAIGGVINVITKRDFSGLLFNASGGVSQHGGGATYGLDATMGINLDRGNITVNVLHDFEGAVGGWQRDWAQDAHQDDPNFPGGSAYRTQLSVLQDASDNKTVWLNGAPHSVSDPSLQIPCSTYITALSKWKLNANCYTPNGGWNTLQGQLARSQLSLNAHYNVTDDVTFVLSGNFTDRRTAQQLRAEPLLGGTIATVDATLGNTVYPGFYIPAIAHWGYSSGGNTKPCPITATADSCVQGNDTPVQFGPRTYRQISETYRFRAGFEGHIANDYNWEIGYVQQRNDVVSKVYNTGNFYHLAQMTGLTPCVDVPGGCTSGAPFGFSWNVPTTPVNFFNGPDNLTKDQVAYLTYTQTDTNRAIENYAYADINGPIVDLWAGTIKGSLGVERRFEHGSDSPDALVQAGYAPNRSFPTDGGYGVTSVYGELFIPVLKDLPLFQSLDIAPSARFDHYSNFGDATTWKAGINWTVNDDLRFRGAYSTNFRAPTVAELFGGNSVSYNAVAGDPCDSRTVINGNSNMPHSAAEAAARLAIGTTCYKALLAAGVAAGSIASYQSPENNLASDQRGLLLGGNSALQPEKAHQWTVGAVLTPHWVNGLSLAGDYYEVTVTNAIIGGVPISIGGSNFLLGCYGAAAGQQNASYCSSITRNTAVGVVQINSTNTNFGVAKISGLDLEANYTNDFETLGIGLPGAFSVNLQAAHQFSNTQSNPDNTISNYLGTYQNETLEALYPKWRGTANFEWDLGDVVLHYDLQWVGAMTDFNVGDDYNVPDYFYSNVSASYDLGTSLGGAASATKLIVGINNLFDKDPPFLSQDSTCKCNSVAGPYDFVGRYFYMRLSLKL